MCQPERRPARRLRGDTGADRLDHRSKAMRASSDRVESGGDDFVVYMGGVQAAASSARFPFKVVASGESTAGA